MSQKLRYEDSSGVPNLLMTDTAREKAERLRIEFISVNLAKSFAGMGRKVKIAARELRSLHALRGDRHA